MNCPVCGSNVRNARLQFGYSFKPYRVCPDCQSKYTTDERTKWRVVLIGIFAFMTAGISAAGFLTGFPWGLVAAFAGVGLLALTGYTLSKVALVEYHDKSEA